MSRRTALHRARRGSAGVALLITVVFAYLAVRNVDLGELSESLRQSNHWMLVPALAALALGFFMRVIRWRLLFVPSRRPDLWPTTYALLVGQFFNNVLPFRAGDAARIVVLHSRTGCSRAETTGTVVIERFFDVLALLLLLFVTLPWFPEVTWLRAAGILAIALLVALLAAVLVLRVFGERPIRFAVRPLSRLPFLGPERVEAAVRNLTQGLVALRSARLGLVAFLWTLASWVVLASSFWLVMVGFDLGLSPVAGFLVVIATGLSMIIPSAPAAVGVFEAAAIVALSAYGVPQTQALSYALVVHALNVLPFVLTGLVAVNVARGARRSQRRGPQVPQGVVRQGRGSGLTGVGGPMARSSGGPRDEQDDVSQPANGHPEVDELRKLR
jgi:uncharacterized protein (TIRG00374 family)